MCFAWSISIDHLEGNVVGPSLPSVSQDAKFLICLS